MLILRKGNGRVEPILTIAPINPGDGSGGRRQHGGEKVEHGGIEGIRPLQRREMADAGQQQEACAGNCPCHVLEVLAADEFIAFAEDAPDRYVDRAQLGSIVVRLRRLHEAEIVPHRGSAAGVIRFHYPLIVPKHEPEKCWIEIGGHHFSWREGVPLVFDDTREHWVKNETKETRVVLIIDFNANMPFPINVFTGLRYNLIRHSSEVKAVLERAAIGVPPRNKAVELQKAA